MAVSRVVTTVVDVGQGQCTFVEIYDDGASAAPVTTLLFDCGTTSPSRPYTYNNIAYIASVIGRMDTPMIDLVVFSHGDSDHINLCYLLLSAFPPPQPLIGQIYYGGAWQNYSKAPGAFNRVRIPDPGDGNRNILTYVQDNYLVAGGSIRSVDPNFSQYANGVAIAPAPIFQTPEQEVKVYVVIGNVLNDGTVPTPGINQAQTDVLLNAGGDPRNRSSIVCSLSHQGNGPFVLCGDAINRTMAEANQHFPGTPQVPSARMITLPHHGSRSTGLGATRSPAATETLEFFARTWSADTFTASAFQKHGHPSTELARYFQAVSTEGTLVRDTRLTGDSHLTVAMLDVNLANVAGENYRTGNYCCIATKTNFFSTYYSPPAAAVDATKTTGKRKSDGSAAGPPVPVAPPAPVPAAEFSYDFQGNYVIPAPDYAGGIVQAINSHACWVYTTLTTGAPSLAGYSQLQQNLLPFTEPIPLAMDSATEVVTAAPTPVQSTIPAIKASTFKAPALPGLRRFR